MSVENRLYDVYKDWAMSRQHGSTASLIDFLNCYNTFGAGLRSYLRSREFYHKRTELRFESSCNGVQIRFYESFIRVLDEATDLEKATSNYKFIREWSVP